MVVLWIILTNENNISKTDVSNIYSLHWILISESGSADSIKAKGIKRKKKHWPKCEATLYHGDLSRHCYHLLPSQISFISSTTKTILAEKFMMFDVTNDWMHNWNILKHLNIHTYVTSINLLTNSH